MIQRQGGRTLFPLTFGLLVCVPGCFTDSQKNSSSEPVVSIGGKPVISGEEYDQSIELLAQAQPAFAQVLPHMAPDQQEAVYGQIADTLAAERVMQEYIKRSGADQTNEYKENARRVHENVDRDLAVRTFQNELAKQIVINDDEAREYYELNKDKNQAFKRPPFVSQGGVVARAVACANEKEANELAQRALKTKSLESSAREMKKDLRDLGVVNTQSFAVDNALRAKISVMKKFPTIEVVRDSAGEFFVVEGIRREETAAAPFDSVRDRVKEIILGERFNDALMKKIEELKREYRVEVNKSFIAKKVSRPVASAPQDEEAVEDTAAKSA